MSAVAVAVALGAAAWTVAARTPTPGLSRTVAPGEEAELRLPAGGLVPVQPGRIPPPGVAAVRPGLWRAEYGGAAFLLAGSLDSRAQRVLAGTPEALRAAVLLAPAAPLAGGGGSNKGNLLAGHELADTAHGGRLARLVVSGATAVRRMSRRKPGRGLPDKMRARALTVWWVPGPSVVNECGDPAFGGAGSAPARVEARCSHSRARGLGDRSYSHSPITAASAASSAWSAGVKASTRSLWTCSAPSTVPLAPGIGTASSEPANR